MSEKESVAKPSIPGMIWSPGEQFEKIRTNPKIWIPLIVLTVMSLLAGWLMTLSPGFEEQMTAGGGVNEEDMSGFITFIKFTTVLSAGFGPAFGVLFSSFIYWLITKATSSEVTFKQLFSMSTFITIIGALGLILNGILLAIFGGSIETLYTSVGSLVDAEGGLGAFLNSIEIFGIWTTILFAIGLHITAGWSKILAWTISIVFFLIGIGFTTLSGALSSMTGM
ncbi:YIP1 family protein [Pseudalkalibacillus hwajinpoensis]|uniref:YIP1 family protein n=1 Tax=Guptibacillus hwajinpoensis TaxID=208199 RepID=UPI00325AF707